MTQKGKIFTLDFVLMFIGNFVLVSVYFLLMVTMALYAITQFCVDSATGGLTASVFLVGGVIGRIVCGRYVHYLGLRTLTIISLAIQVIACICYFFNGLGIVFLICLRFVHGLSFGIANTTIPAMAVEQLPKYRIGEGTGYFMLSNSLGVGIGPLMSILVVMGIDYQILFIICTILSIVILGAILLSRYGRTFVRGPKPGRFTLASVIDTSTVQISVFMFFVAFAYSSMNAFVNVYAQEQGWGMYAPFIFLVYSIALLISRPITGKLMDRYGENIVLYPSIICMGICVIIAACAVNPFMLLSCGIFMALGFGTCMSVGQAVVTKRTRQKGMTLAISTFFLLLDTGCGIGPVFLGLIANVAGLRIMYWFCALISLCGLAYYHVVHGRGVKRARRDNTPHKQAEG